jgi:hypothetical protein
VLEVGEGRWERWEQGGGRRTLLSCVVPTAPAQRCSLVWLRNDLLSKPYHVSLQPLHREQADEKIKSKKNFFTLKLSDC